MKKFLQTHPAMTKWIIFIHTLLAQHVSTLNYNKEILVLEEACWKKAEFFFSWSPTYFVL
jgi:hypothetical protein